MIVCIAVILVCASVALTGSITDLFTHFISQFLWSLLFHVLWPVLRNQLLRQTWNQGTSTSPANFMQTISLTCGNLWAVEWSKETNSLKLLERKRSDVWEMSLTSRSLCARLGGILNLYFWLECRWVPLYPIIRIPVDLKSYGNHA